MSRRIVIIGGGISGLAAAHRLVELKGSDPNDRVELALLEASEHAGGTIGTEHLSGFLVERGPDSFITEKPWAIQLCDRLGITSNLISLSPARRNIYVVYQGRLVPLPEGFILMAPTRLWPLIRTPLFSWPGKLRMAVELFLPRGKSSDDESMASFIRRRFGQELLERVAQPLMGGIYAADPEELSLKSTMPRFLEFERSRRSIIWASWLEQRRRARSQRGGSGARWGLFVSFKEGMQLLVDTLVDRLPAGTLRLGTQAKTLNWNDAGKSWRITTDGGEALDADGVIVALPSHAASKVLSSVDLKLSQELAAIPYTSTATVTVAYRREDIPDSLNGFGVVVPAMERREIIACSFSSMKYEGRAPSGHELIRAFVGGALQPELFEQRDEELEQSVSKEVAALLGIKGKPILCHIQRHPRSMPQYRVGHLKRVEGIDRLLANHKGLALAGNAYRGVGVSDCVHGGEMAAEAILDQLKRHKN
ncbi:MAG: protoporphyrinogen oxidase [Deltaproteobacteria bacterium]|nr:protoporphyrinogen oxidase [Deltaproteobacteria bacterium]